MNVFDILLQRIVILSRNREGYVTVHPRDGYDLRFYFIGGGSELPFGCAQELLPRIENGGFEEIFVLEWSFSNSASMIESGMHFFLSHEAAEVWRDGNENAAFHGLEVRRLTEDQARIEVARLEMP